MNPSKYSQETLQRMRENAAAAKRRLERLNAEYLIRQKARRIVKSTTKREETFGEAVARVAKESQITL